MLERIAEVLPAFRLGVRRELVWLAEQAAVSAVLGPFALVVWHAGRLARLGGTCTARALAYTLRRMAAERNRRINVTLEPDYARKLASLAERTHVQEGTLARSLLSSALDEADPDASRITEILNGIPGAWERAQASIEQARRGETVPLSEL